MAGGGKTSKNETKINPQLAAAAGPLVDKANAVSKLPYMANRGIQYAAFTPDQEAAFNNTNNAAAAFGLGTGGGTGLPEAETVNGFRGYSSAPLYDDMVNKSVPQGAQDYIADFFHDFSDGNPNDKKPTSSGFTDNMLKQMLSNSSGDDWAGERQGYLPTENQRIFNDRIADRNFKGAFTGPYNDNGGFFGGGGGGGGGKGD